MPSLLRRFTLGLTFGLAFVFAGSTIDAQTPPPPQNASPLTGSSEGSYPVQDSTKKLNNTLYNLQLQNTQLQKMITELSKSLQTTLSAASIDQELKDVQNSKIPPRIYLHITNNISSEDAEQTRGLLETIRVGDERIVVPQLVRDNLGDQVTLLRYFRADDAGEANLLKTAIRKVMPALPKVDVVGPVSSNNLESIRPRQYELLLSFTSTEDGCLLLSGGPGGKSFHLPLDQGYMLKVRAETYVEDIAVHNEPLKGWEEVPLQPGEKLKQISGATGTFVDSLSLETSAGRKYSFGGEGGGHKFSFVAPSGQAITGICGRRGKFLDAIGVIVQ